MTIMEKIEAMLHTFEEEDKEAVAAMIAAAGDYVHAVVLMLEENRNYFCRSGEDLRKHKEAADRERRSCHDAFIDRVNIINKMCAFYQLEPFYTGGEARREYGDFAMDVVETMFASR